MQLLLEADSAVNRQTKVEIVEIWECKALDQIYVA